jgi:hypothetical protein
MIDARTSGFDWYGVSPSGVEMALHVELEDAARVDELVQALAKADAQLAVVGFKRSERLSQSRGFGGGGGGGRQQRQEAQPPTDVVVPEHCGLPMVYHPERPAVGDKRPLGAHWDCRKGSNCEQARVQGDRTFPFTNWRVEVKPIEPSQDPEKEPRGDWNTFANWSERQGFDWNLVVKKREAIIISKGLPRAELWTQNQINRLMATLEREPGRYRAVAASVNGAAK